MQPPHRIVSPSPSPRLSLPLKCPYPPKTFLRYLLPPESQVNSSPWHRRLRNPHQSRRFAGFPTDGRRQLPADNGLGIPIRLRARLETTGGNRRQGHATHIPHLQPQHETEKTHARGDMALGAGDWQRDVWEGLARDVRRGRQLRPSTRRQGSQEEG